MQFTPGELLFYGGLAGMAAVLLIAVIVIIVQSGTRRRLRRKLQEDYGKQPK